MLDIGNIINIIRFILEGYYENRATRFLKMPAKPLANKVSCNVALVMVIAVMEGYCCYGDCAGVFEDKSSSRMDTYM